MRAGWVTRESWASLLWCDPWLSWPFTAMVSLPMSSAGTRGSRRRGPGQRPRLLQAAPVVVFHMNILSYFAFSACLPACSWWTSSPSPPAASASIYVWLFSLVCEGCGRWASRSPSTADPPTPRSILASITARWPAAPCHAVSPTWARGWAEASWKSVAFALLATSALVPPPPEPLKALVFVKLLSPQR